MTLSLTTCGFERNPVRWEGNGGKEETKLPRLRSKTCSVKDFLIEMTRFRQADVAAARGRKPKEDRVMEL